MSTLTKLDYHPHIDADKNIGTPAGGQKHGMPHLQINADEETDAPVGSGVPNNLVGLKMDEPNPDGNSDQELWPKTKEAFQHDDFGSMDVLRATKRREELAENAKNKGPAQVTRQVYTLRIKVSFWGSGTLKIVNYVENHPQKRNLWLAVYHPPLGWGVLISGNNIYTYHIYI